MMTKRPQNADLSPLATISLMKESDHALRISRYTLRRKQEIPMSLTVFPSFASGVVEAKADSIN